MRLLSVFLVAFLAASVRAKGGTLLLKSSNDTDIFIAAINASMAVSIDEKERKIMTIDNSGVAIAGELTANGVSLSEMAATLATLQDEVATLRQLVNVITPPPGFPPPPGSPPPSPPPPLAPPASPLPEGCVQSNSTNELVCADCTITATQTGVDCLRLMLDWTVPSGVTTLTAKGWGGGGLSNSDGHSGGGFSTPAGGGGGRTTPAPALARHLPHAATTRHLPHSHGRRRLLGDSDDCPGRDTHPGYQPLLPA